MPEQSTPTRPLSRSDQVVDRHATRRLPASIRQLLTAELVVAATGRESAAIDSALARQPELAAHLPVLAEGHGVAALVSERLGRTLPSEPAAALADAAARTRARGVRLAADRDVLTAALVVAELPFAALKWAALAGRLYGDASLRPAADLDLWIPEQHRPGTESVLRDLGYQPTSVTWKHRVYIRSDNQAVVDPRGEHPENPRPVEVHGQLRESFRGLDLVLATDEAVTSPDVQLPDAVHLLHLAAHASVDALSRRLRLIQLLDLARLAEQLNPSDWQNVDAWAASPNAARFIWPSLALARHVVGARVPTTVLDSLARQVKPALVEWVAAANLDELSWFGGPSAPRPLDEVLRIWPYSRREAVVVWRFIVLPARAALADRYPRLSASRAWWLIYPRHGAYSGRLLWRRWRRRG
jgi:hypothetical protein